LTVLVTVSAFSEKVKEVFERLNFAIPSGHLYEAGIKE
jgi:hypothetical protein